MASLTEDEWLREAAHRISISEGVKLSRYLDSMGIPTIGIGFNLTRGYAPMLAVGITNPSAVTDGHASITLPQALALLQNDLTSSLNSARASLDAGVFASLTQPRQFVITDLNYNMGSAGWLSFTGTRDLINMAQKAKNANNPSAHQYFQAAGNHLEASNYYDQVGNRAKRNVAMLITGEWCDANGDGSDTYKE